MNNISSTKNMSNIFGFLSLSLALINFLLMINWIFEVIPYVDFQVMPVLIALIIGPFGVLLGAIATIICPNKLSKWGTISNAILFLISFLYFLLGAFI